MLVGGTGLWSVTTARSALKEDLRYGGPGEREISGGYGPRGASGKALAGWALAGEAGQQCGVGLRHSCSRGMALAIFRALYLAGPRGSSSTVLRVRRPTCRSTGLSSEWARNMIAKFSAQPLARVRRAASTRPPAPPAAPDA